MSRVVPQVVEVTVDDDQRPTVTCPHCRTRFTPGTGQVVPEQCLGCRAAYPMSEETRASLDVLCLLGWKALVS